MDRSPASSTSPSDLSELLGDWTLRPGPLYRRLADAVGDAVRAGDLVAGDRLPSERALARGLGLSRATVVGAYDDLRGRGLVESRRGSGTTVLTGTPRPDGRAPGGRIHAVFQRLIDRPDEIISLANAGVSAPPELRRALTQIDLDGLLADPGHHPAGLPAMREAVADHLTRGGLPTRVEQVLVTTGVSQGLALVGQLYLHRRARVVVESPSWAGCLDVFRAAGAEPIGVPLDEDGVRPELPGEADLLYVAPTFHNPTGVLMSAARRRRIAELAARRGLAILEDHALDVPVGRVEVPPPIAAYAPGRAEVLTAGSLTKTVWSGLRVGWIRGPEDVVGRLSRLKILADFGGPLLDQAVAAWLMPRLGALATARSEELTKRLDALETLLRDALPEWRWRRPQGGTSVWIELPVPDAGVFARVALRHGVEIVPGAAMDPRREHDSWIRVPFTFPVEVINEVVRRLAAAWRDLRTPV